MKIPLQFILAAAILLPAGMAISATAADMKLEAQLVWGTHESKSPDPSHKPVEPEVRKKLEDLPLKWSIFFEVNRKQFSVAPDKTGRADLSDKCAVEVRNLGSDKVEVSLFGRGKAVLKRVQSLARKEILVLGGNAPDANAWLVVLKRIE